MQFSLPFIDIIIFAVIAVFLIYRLKNILGEKTGYDSSEDEKNSLNKNREKSNVIDFSGKNVSKSNSEIEFELNKIKTLDKSFSLDEFVSGARIFFQMVIDSFVKGDLSNVRDFVKPSLLENFQAAINERNKENESLVINVKKIENVSIKSITINNNFILIKVLFDTNQIKVLKDKNKKIIDGNLRKVIKVKDIWSFERKIVSENKNWTLIETSTE